MRSTAPPLLVVAALLAASAALAAHANGPDAARDVDFDSRNGNEWWVQVRLSGADASSVVSVQAQDTGGPWKTLEKKSWGDWAASFHVEPGHEVRFVASFSDGGHVTSCWMTHPGGEPTRCEGGGGDDGGSGAYAFDHEGGNEWWVQVAVSPGPAAVQAMDTGGAWKTLEKKSWGDWAASFHVEPGHEVRFRAHGGDGAWDESCWFTHPAGGVARCEGGEEEAFAASFRTNGGNEWWVSTYVDANRPLAGVDARVVGEDAWRALTKRDWGAWAASFHVEDGSLVEFRATAQDGSVAVSEDVFRWPEGAREERQTAPAWPQEGSYVRYLLDSGESVGGWSEDTLLWLNYTYQAGAWVGTCEGWHVEGYDGNDTRERVTRNVTAPPPRAPVEGVEPGEGLDVAVPSCGDRGTATTFAYVDGRGEQSVYHYDEPHRQHGEPVAVPVWTASYEEDGCPCQWRSVEWHWDTGLTVNRVTNYRYSYESAHLVDTDAPISPEETSEPPRPDWPQEGSYARYLVNLTDDDGTLREQFTAEFTYVDGAWQASCRGETLAQAPPLGPTDTQPGAKARPTEASGCRISPPPVVVQGRFPEDTTRHGVPHRATVWWGDEGENTYGDEDAWWDVDTGLLLRWEDHGGYYQGDEGYLTDTDAPLSSG